MKQEYDCDDIHKALCHVTRYQVFDGKAIERILSASANKNALESYRTQKAKQELKNVLPRIRQRPLDEYSALFQEQEK